MNAIRADNRTLLEGPILPKILRFALPIMLTNLLQALYHAADMIVVGLSGVEGAIGAIGTCGSMLNFIVNVFIGFSVGANVVVARSIGAGDRGATVRAVHTAITLSVIFGFVSLAVGQAACRGVLIMLGDEGHVLDLATLYARIYIAGAPAMCLTNYAAAIFRAKGDSQTPLLVLSISGLTNVLLNLFFVLVCGMSVDGVALATVLANVMSAAWLVIGLTRDHGWCRLVLRKLHVFKTELLQIVQIGVPAGIQSALFSFSNMLIQSSVVGLNNAAYPGGSVIIDGSAAGASVENLAYVVTNSIYHTTVTFVSQHVGARDYPRLKRVIAMLFLVSFCIAEFSSLLILLVLRGPLVGLYVQGDAAKYAVKRLYFTLSAYFTIGAMEVGSGVLRGMGKSLTCTIVTLIGSCLLRIVWLLTVFRAYPMYEIIFAAYPISWFITSSVYLIIMGINMPKLREKFSKPVVRSHKLAALQEQEKDDPD